MIMRDGFLFDRSGSLIVKMLIGWIRSEIGEEAPSFDRIRQRVSSWNQVGPFTVRRGTFFDRKEPARLYVKLNREMVNLFYFDQVYSICVNFPTVIVPMIANSG